MYRLHTNKNHQTTQRGAATWCRNVVACTVGAPQGTSVNKARSLRRADCQRITSVVPVYTNPSENYHIPHTFYKLHVRPRAHALEYVLIHGNNAPPGPPSSIPSRNDYIPSTAYKLHVRPPAHALEYAHNSPQHQI